MRLCISPGGTQIRYDGRDEISRAFLLSEVDVYTGVPRVKVNTSGLNSIPNSESKISYTHVSDSQRLLS